MYGGAVQAVDAVIFCNVIRACLAEHYVDGAVDVKVPQKHEKHPRGQEVRTQLCLAISVRSRLEASYLQSFDVNSSARSSGLPSCVKGVSS